MYSIYSPYQKSPCFKDANDSYTSYKKYIAFFKKKNCTNRSLLSSNYKSQSTRKIEKKSEADKGFQRLFIKKTLQGEQLDDTQQLSEMLSCLCSSHVVQELTFKSILQNNENSSKLNCYKLQCVFSSCSSILYKYVCSLLNFSMQDSLIPPAFQHIVDQNFESKVHIEKHQSQGELQKNKNF